MSYSSPSYRLTPQRWLRACLMLGFLAFLVLHMARAQSLPFASETQSGAALGVSVLDVVAADVAAFSLPEERGARVTEVHPQTSAAVAGFLVHDVIVAVNRRPLESTFELLRRIQDIPLGRDAVFTVIRQGRALDLNARLQRPGQPVLGAAPDAAAAPPAPNPEPVPKPEHPQVVPPDRLGAQLQPVEGQLARFFGVAEGESGLLLRSVVPTGGAARAGLQAGDVILGLDGERTPTDSALMDALVASEGAAVRVTVLRDRKPLTIELPGESL